MLRRLSASPLTFPRLNIDRHVLATALLAVIGMGYLIAYIALFSQYLADDAYIHLRIARNFATYGVPYYNAGDAISGSSSPLWTILLAGLYLVTGPTPAILPWACGLVTIGVGATLTALLRPVRGTIGSILLAGLIIAFGLLDVAALGMETPLALLWWTLSVLALRRRAIGWAGWWAALLVATRYEGVLWLLLAGLIVGRPVRWRYASGAAAPLAALALYHWWFFGTQLPQTVRAKGVVYQLTLIESLQSGGLAPLGLLLLGVTGAALLVFLRSTHGADLIRGVVGFPLLLLTLYLARHTLFFSWYLPLIVVPLLVACLMTPGWRGLLLLVACAVAMPQTWGLALRDGAALARGDADGFRDAALGQRVHQYLRIGADQQAMSPGATLMTSEIGGIGWSFSGRIIDAVGLVSPEVLRYHPMAVPTERSSGGLGAIPPAVVADLQPDIVVSMPVFAEAFRRNPAGYTRTRVYPLAMPLWGDSMVEVWRRNTQLRFPYDFESGPSSQTITRRR